MSSFDVDLTNAKNLLDTLGTSHPKYLDAHTLFKRLEENISKAELYGDTSDLAASRAQIRRELDKISLDVLHRTFDMPSVDLSSLGRRSSSSSTAADQSNISKIYAKSPQKAKSDNTLPARGCSTAFQIIIGIAAIISCLAAILVIPQIQNLLSPATTPMSTQTYLPAVTLQPIPTDLIWDDPVLSNTPADTILEPDQTWYGGNLKIRLGKPVFSGCNGTVLAFELSFMNVSSGVENIDFSGLDIIVTNQGNQYYTRIAYKQGAIVNGCDDLQQVVFVSLLNQETMDPRSRLDYVIYVFNSPQALNANYFLVKILNFGTIKNATWKISVQ